MPDRIMEQKNHAVQGEHVLLCLSGAPSNEAAVRAAARMARAYQARFTALYVETPALRHQNAAGRERLHAHLQLAEQLGAQVVTAYGENVAFQIVQYARADGVSKIVVGHSGYRRLLLFKGELAQQLIRLAPELEIYLVPRGQEEEPPSRWEGEPRFHLRLLDFLKMLGLLLACTGIGWMFHLFGLRVENITPVYLLGAMGTAMLTQGIGCNVLFSLLSVICFNFFIVEPVFSMRAYDPGYPVTFLMLLVCSFVTSSLTTRIKRQAELAARRARRTETLLETSRRLQRTGSEEEIIQAAAKQIGKLLDRTVIFYPVQDETLGEPRLFQRAADEQERTLYQSEAERQVARWVLRRARNAGMGTTVFPEAAGYYLAVRGGQTVLAVIGVAQRGGTPADPFERGLLLAMVNEIAFAMEKLQMLQREEQISMQAEREHLRANLLRSISHDLRTPLTSISGNAGVLLYGEAGLEPEKRRALYADIYEDANWLTGLVENLLALTRVDNLELTMEPELIDEVIDEALRHLGRRNEKHQIVRHLPEELLMARMDAKLVMQVIINLVDNALKYTPAGSTITISAGRQGRWVVVEVADNGPGISEENQQKIFDQFFTVDHGISDGRRGLGLGLSLCRSIIHAHGGEIFVHSNEPVGSVFGFTLQLEEVAEDEKDHAAGCGGR